MQRASNSILGDGINLQYIIQYLQSWEPIPNKVIDRAGPRQTEVFDGPTTDFQAPF